MPNGKNICITLLVIPLVNYDIPISSKFYSFLLLLASCFRIDHRNAWVTQMFFHCKSIPKDSNRIIVHSCGKMEEPLSARNKSKGSAIKKYFANFCVIFEAFYIDFKIKYTIFIFDSRGIFFFLKKHDHILNFCLYCKNMIMSLEI